MKSVDTLFWVSLPLRITPYRQDHRPTETLALQLPCPRCSGFPPVLCISPSPASFYLSHLVLLCFYYILLLTEFRFLNHFLFLFHRNHLLLHHIEISHDSLKYSLSCCKIFSEELPRIHSQMRPDVVNRNSVCFPDNFPSGGPCTHCRRPALKGRLIGLPQLLTSDQLSFRLALLDWHGFGSGGWTADVYQAPHPAPLLLPWVRLERSWETQLSTGGSTAAGVSLPRPAPSWLLSTVSRKLQFSVCRWREWKASGCFKRDLTRQVLAASFEFLNSWRKQVCLFVCFSSSVLIFQPSSTGLVLRWKFLRDGLVQVDCSPGFQLAEFYLRLSVFEMILVGS